jgi:hypothetical protein
MPKNKEVTLDDILTRSAPPSPITLTLRLTLPVHTRAAGRSLENGYGDNGKEAF